MKTAIWGFGLVVACALVVAKWGAEILHRLMNLF
jgi:hypothetical protein